MNTIEINEFNEAMRECLKAIDKAMKSSAEVKQAFLQLIEKYDGKRPN